MCPSWDLGGLGLARRPGWPAAGEGGLSVSPFRDRSCSRPRPAASPPPLTRLRGGDCVSVSGGPPPLGLAGFGTVARIEPAGQGPRDACGGGVITPSHPNPASPPVRTAPSGTPSSAGERALGEMQPGPPPTPLQNPKRGGGGADAAACQPGVRRWLCSRTHAVLAHVLVAHWADWCKWAPPPLLLLVARLGWSVCLCRCWRLVAVCVACRPRFLGALGCQPFQVGVLGPWASGPAVRGRSPCCLACRPRFLGDLGCQPFQAGVLGTWASGPAGSVV